LNIIGISKGIADALVARTVELGQGRGAGAIGFRDDKGYITEISEIVDGGLRGVPFRKLVSRVVGMEKVSVIEMIEDLPDNAVFISTRPGKTGLNTDIWGVGLFNLPVITIGVRENAAAGVSVIYPKPEFFDLATTSEDLRLKTLDAKTMEEEKAVLLESLNLDHRYLEASSEVPIVDMSFTVIENEKHSNGNVRFPRLSVNSIDGTFAREMVARSLAVGQGREVAAIGHVDSQGHVTPVGAIVAGGIGYVPARLLASSAVDITGKSLREVYARLMPGDVCIVHTHPGGTGVMHIGDAGAGPGSWGRPIIAIGHDKDGRIRGATVLEPSDKMFELFMEDEELSLRFFQAETAQEETEIRNRQFGIAQEFTNLCKELVISE
jgi:hypothetical protein